MTKTERERLQELACDMCHQPYACANEDELAKACENCPISAEMCEMEEEPKNELGKDINVPRWIPVEERLPQIGQRVLAVGRHERAMYTATYSGGIKETAYKKANPYKIITGENGWRTFTYWMPLPEPPMEVTP